MEMLIVSGLSKTEVLRALGALRALDLSLGARDNTVRANGSASFRMRLAGGDLSPTLVQIRTSCLRPRRNSPSNASALPPPYAGATSNHETPASKARAKLARPWWPDTLEPREAQPKPRHDVSASRPGNQMRRTRSAPIIGVQGWIAPHIRSSKKMQLRVSSLARNK